MDSDTVLVVVDVQNDFCAGVRWRCPMVMRWCPWSTNSSQSLSPWCSRRTGTRQATVHLPQRMKANRRLRWWHSITASRCFGQTTAFRSRGADFHPDLNTAGATMVVRKGFRRRVDSYSAFYENDRSTVTGLTGFLRTLGAKKLVMVGLATDFCVAYSALDARHEGFDVTVVMSGCRAIDLDGSLSSALANMDAAGIHRVESF